MVDTVNKKEEKMSKNIDLKLPPYWAARESRSRPGMIYYVNYKTKTTTWTHPGKASSAGKDEQNSTIKTSTSSKEKCANPNIASASDISASKEDEEVKRRKIMPSVSTDKTPDGVPRKVLVAKRRMVPSTSRPSKGGEDCMLQKGGDSRKDEGEILDNLDPPVQKRKLTPVLPSNETSKGSLIFKTVSDDFYTTKKSTERKFLEEKVHQYVEMKKPHGTQDEGQASEPCTLSSKARYKKRRKERENEKKKLEAEKKQKQVMETMTGDPTPTTSDCPRPTTTRRILKGRRQLSKETPQVVPQDRPGPMDKSLTNTGGKIDSLNNTDQSQIPSPLCARESALPKAKASSSPQNASSDVRTNSALKLPSNTSSKQPPVSDPIKCPLQQPTHSKAPVNVQSPSLQHHSGTSQCEPSSSTTPTNRLKPQSQSTGHPASRQLSTPLTSLGLHTPKSDPPMTRTQPDEKNGEVDMEVEMDSTLLTDLCEVRRTISTEKMEEGGIPEFILREKDLSHGSMSPSPSTNKKIYIVIDTNVLMHDLKFVDRLKDQSSSDYGYPYLVVPWVVMQELDCLKNGKSKTTATATKMLARQPVNFLHECLKCKHPRILCQTPMEERNQENIDLKVECNDDRILRCCLEWKQKCPDAEVVLLTMDKNLKNKAMIIGITALSTQALQTFLWGATQKTLLSDSSPRTSFCEASRKTGKKKEEHAGKQTGLVPVKSVPEKSVPEKSDPEKSIPDNRATYPAVKLAGEIYSEVRTLMRDFLALVMETEMKRVYEELWDKIVFIKPPWSLDDLLACLKKHMIAVFGEIIPRKDQDVVDYLLGQFKIAHLSNFPDIRTIISECGTLLQCLGEWNSYGGQSERVTKTIRTLYTITTDAMHQNLKPATLQELRKQYEKTENPTPATSERNEVTPQAVTEHVVQIFQTAWENILFCKNHLESNLHNCDAIQRSKYVTFLAQIGKVLLNLSNTYSQMLGLSDDVSPAHRQSVLNELCSCLDAVANEACIQPWISMNPRTLEVYMSMGESGVVLKNGFMQLQGFITGYHEVWKQLTAAEQALTAL